VLEEQQWDAGDENAWALQRNRAASPKVKSWGRVLAEGVYHQIQDGADTGPVLVGELG
jgi:hypothetical protein